MYVGARYLTVKHSQSIDALDDECDGTHAAMVVGSRLRDCQVRALGVGSAGDAGWSGAEGLRTLKPVLHEVADGGDAEQGAGEEVL